MKRWRALSGEKKVFYILTPGLPLAAVLLPCAMNIRRFTFWMLNGGWFCLALPAPGILLGTVNLCLFRAGRQPGNIDAWHVLMAATLLPSLFLLGIDLLVVLFAAALALDPTW